MTIPVLIVGAGPVGSTIALALLRNGIPVKIIDKDGPQIGSKGFGIQPRSLEVHHFLGTLPDILKQAKRLPPCHFYKLPGGTEVLNSFEFEPYSEPTPDCPLINFLALGQQRQQAILHNHLSKFGCHVEFGTELQSFEQRSDYVSATIVHKEDGKDMVKTIEYQYLIGTDGAHSIVRKMLGVSFLGDTRRDTDMVLGDIHVRGGLDRKIWHGWGETSKGLVSLLPTEEDDDCFTFHIAGHEIDLVKTASGREELLKTMEAVSDRKDIVYGDIHWMSYYRPNIRMVDKLNVGRVLIAGDSAHIHSPSGGQGSNSGIQDAFNLGWKLALVVKGLSPQSLLDSFSEERLPVIAAMLDKSTLLLNKAYAPLQGDKKGNPWARGKELHQLGVNCRGSSILVDETATEEIIRDSYNLAKEGELHAGDRAPDAPGLSDTKDTLRLFDIFGPAHHTVLVFSVSSNARTAIAALSVLDRFPKELFRTVLITPSGDVDEFLTGSVDYVLEDKANHAYQFYPASGRPLTIVVVRPDGVVGAIVGGDDGLRKYVARVFV